MKAGDEKWEMFGNERQGKDWCSGELDGFKRQIISVIREQRLVCYLEKELLQRAMLGCALQA